VTDAKVVSWLVLTIFYVPAGWCATYRLWNFWGAAQYWIGDCNVCEMEGVDFTRKHSLRDSGRPCLVPDSQTIIPLQIRQCVLNTTPIGCRPIKPIWVSHSCSLLGMLSSVIGLYCHYFRYTFDICDVIEDICLMVALENFCLRVRRLSYYSNTQQILKPTNILQDMNYILCKLRIFFGHSFTVLYFQLHTNKFSKYLEQNIEKAAI